MGLFSKAADKVTQRIDEAQTCTSCGCNADRSCDNCTRSDCHCSSD